MNFQWLLIFVAFITIPRQPVFCQAWDDKDIYNEEAIMRSPVFLENCYSPFCAPACEGAAPPRICPENMTECIFGCTCFNDCKHVSVVCFQTKQCLGKKTFKGRSKKRMNVTKLLVN